MSCKENNKPAPPALDIFTLPLISQFKYLQFNGRADNVNLIPNFNFSEIQGKYIIIKGIKIVPYYEDASIDMYLGVATETIPGNCRINRVFDAFAFGTNLTIFINEVAARIFPQYTAIVPPFVGGNVPLDLDDDNIFYKYPEKISSLDIAVDSLIFNDILFENRFCS